MSLDDDYPHVKWRVESGSLQKRCPKCRNYVDFSEEAFYRNKSEVSGFDPYCKICRDDINIGCRIKRKKSTPAPCPPPHGIRSG